MNESLTPERFEELLRAYADAYGKAVLSGKREDIEAAAEEYMRLRKAVFP